MSNKVVVGVIIENEDELPSLKDLKLNSIKTTVSIAGFMVLDLAGITLKAISLDECSTYFSSIDLTYIPLYVNIKSSIDSSGALVRNIVEDDISGTSLVGRCIYNSNGLLENMPRIIKVKMANWVDILIDLVTGDFSFSYLDLIIIDGGISDVGSYEMRSFLGFNFKDNRMFIKDSGAYIFENVCVADSIKEDVIIPSRVNKIALKLNKYSKSIYNLIIPPSVTVAKFVSYFNPSSFKINYSPINMYVSNANSSIILNALEDCLKEDYLKNKNINYSNIDDLLSVISEELGVNVYFY